MMMDEKAREARRIYKREWARRNQDKVKAANLRFWTKQAERLEKQKAAAAGTSEDKPQAAAM
jgi:hypothetical protein